MRALGNLGNLVPMGEERIASAMARIEAAMERIIAAREKAQANASESASSSRVMALVNSHEKLREEVADTMRDLDALIEELDA